MSIKRNAFIELFWKVHPKLYRWSNGRIGGSMMGMPILLLTTTGRKSGLLRTKALMYLPHGENVVVIASILGEPRHPFWWLNLEADPNAFVEIGGFRYPVRAYEAESEEREEIWQLLIDKAPAYNQYQEQTDRRIPVVVLEKQ